MKLKFKYRIRLCFKYTLYTWSEVIFTNILVAFFTMIKHMR